MSHDSQQVGNTRGEELGGGEGGGSSVSERGMVHRRLEILRKMLTCKQIRPLVVKLVSIDRSLYRGEGEGGKACTPGGG